MIEISRLSRQYEVHRLGDPDADAILELCQSNQQYYQYSETEPTKEQVLNDLHITPPGITPADKYYVGFYRGNDLIAVMDLIDGYPEKDIGYIGFFMMNKALQGQGIGTSIVKEVAAYLKTTGKTSIRLAIDKENPQSTYFWKKNGFVAIKETDRNGWTMLVAEQELFSGSIIEHPADQ
ncbi:MAG: GNAT family N-acetyltransferase [Lachnospiraceae bacterium]|nr:GNAT family N-acetyltransferase [Lachnospiraceae bacterium]